MRKMFGGKKYEFHRTSLVSLIILTLVFGLFPPGFLQDFSATRIPSAQAIMLDQGKTLSETVPADTSTIEKVSRDDISLNGPITAKPQLKELVEKRTERTRVFDKGDGTRLVRLYQEPVNYKENGKWKEVDSSIKQSANGDFENTANLFKTRFANKGKSSALTVFGYDEATVTCSLYEPQSNDVTPVIDGNKITYENILPDTDIREFVRGRGIKEDIVLKKYTGNNNFTFELKMTGVRAVEEKDGSIGFYKNGSKDKSFYIPKPFMFDSYVKEGSDEGTRCETVTADIVKKGSRTFLTIAANDEWLKSPERKYPVYIDPTMQLSTFTDSSYDSYVSSQYAASNFDDDVVYYGDEYINRMKCGYKDPSEGTNYPYIYMDVEDEPDLDGAIINSATLFVYCYYKNSMPDVWVNMVSGDWDPDTITWYNQPENIGYRHASVAGNNWAGINVIEAVEEYLNGYATNNGFMLHENSNGIDYWKGFVASENGDWRVPYLEINYEYPQQPVPAAPAAPTLDLVSMNTNGESCRVYFNWNEVDNADGYIVQIWNGSYYEDFDVGYTTSWDTWDQGIWPTESEITSGRFTLHHDGEGDELSDNPSLVYANANGAGGYNYQFRVKAYNDESGASSPSGVSSAYSPDRTAPTTTITAPVDGSYVSTPTTQVNYTVTDARSTIANIQVKIDGETTSCPSGSIKGPFLEGEHIVRVYGYDSVGNYDIEENVFTIDTAPPSKPTALSVTAEDGHNDLTWRVSEDTIAVEGYDIYRSLTSGGTFEKINSSIVTATTYADSSVINGTIYYYKVQARDKVAHLSPYSDEASARYAADATPPTAPQWVIVTPESTTTVTVTWGTSLDNVEVTDYAVDRSQDGSDWTHIATTTAGVFSNSYTDTGLSAGITYRYRVAAIDAVGNISSYSTETLSSALTTVRFEDNSSSVQYDGPWNDYAGEDASGGTAKYSNDESATATFTFEGTSVSWIGEAGPSDGIARVYIDSEYQQEVDQYRSEYIGSTPVYSKSGLSYGQHTLRIEVTGLKNANSTDSYIDIDAFDVVEANDVIAPTEPINLSAIAVSENRIDIGWDYSTDNIGISGYRIERSTDGTNFTEIATVTSNSYTDDIVMAGTVFYYRVRAYDAMGNNSSYSNLTQSHMPVVRYEESSSNITYYWADEWDIWQYGELSGEFDKYTSGTDNYASLSFMGTAVTLLCARGPNKGIAKIYVDDEYQEDIDLFNPSFYMHQVPVYAKSNLSFGPHTIKVVCTGLKNPASNDNLVDVDAFDVVGLPDTEAPSVPPNFATTTTETDTVSLYWSPSIDNAGISGYKIERSTDGTTFTQVTTETPGTFNYTDDTIISGMTYYYRIKAFDAAGNTSNPSKVLQTNATIPIRYEETSNAVDFEGDWDSWENEELSGGELLWSDTTNDTATITFTGTSITWLGSKGRYGGSVNVYIDNEFEENVDLYSETFVHGRPVYTKTDLPEGIHTLKIVITGQRHEGSFGKHVDVDAFDVQVNDIQAPTAPTNLTAVSTGDNEVSLNWSDSMDNVDVVGYKIERSTDNENFTLVATIATGTTYTGTGLSANTTYYYRVAAVDAAGNTSGYSNTAQTSTLTIVRYEGNSPAMTYVGWWGTWEDSRLSSGSERFTTGIDSAVTFTFTGTSVTCITTKGSNEGIASVYVDDVYQQNIDLYSTYSMFQAPAYTKSGLPYGSHTIRIVFNGQKNIASSDYLIEIDAFDVLGLPDTQAPSAPTNLAGTTTTTDTVSLYWGFATDNTGVDGYKIERSTDGTNFSQIATLAAGAYSYDDEAVSSGTTYYYRVKAYDASGNVSNPSNLLQTNARVATRYEETSPEAVFDGSWENWDSGSLSGGAALCSVTASDTVTFAFTGTSVTWLTDRGPNQGIADIYIDDVFQQEVDAYSDSNNFMFGPVYTKSGLPSGTHTLKIVVTGRSRMEANSEWVDIDAFDIADASTADDTMAPSNPTDLVAIASTENQIDVTWSESTDNIVVKGYKVERSTDGITYIQISKVETNSYTDETVIPNTTYYYRVTSYDAAGNNSGYSNVSQTQAVATVRYEESSPNISYSDTWNTWRYDELSGGFDKYTSETSSSATLTFTGTSVTLICAKGPNKGIAKVYVDGEYRADVDLFNPSFYAHKSQVYTKSGLPFGVHIIQVVCSGQKNFASDDYLVDIDAFDVAGLPDTQAPSAPTNLAGTTTTTDTVSLYWGFATDNTGVDGYKIERSTDGTNFSQIATLAAGAYSYDDEAVSSGTTYYYRVKAYDASGNVSNPSNLLQTNARVATRYEETSPEAVFDGSWENWDSGSLSGGAALCSVTASDTVTFAFTGTSVTWLSDMSPYCGIAEIYIDGVFQQNIDLYSDYDASLGPVYTKSGLPAGSHTLKIVATGQKRAEAWEAYTDIDAFDVREINDTESPTAPTNLVAISQGINQVDITWTESIDNIGVSGYKIERSTNGLDFSEIASISTNAYTDIALSSGTSYYYRVRAFDLDENYSTYSNATQAQAQMKVRYEDNSPAITYTDDWWGYADESLSNGYAQYCSEEDNTATFTFTGTSVTWLTPRNTNRGIARIYVDDIYQEDIDLYGPFYMPIVPVYSKSELPFGSHTIRIEVTGQKNIDSSESLVTIDAFDVLGLPDTQAPSAPTNLAGTTTTTDTVSLYWGFATDNTGVDGYKIERSTDGTNFSQIATLAAGAYSYDDEAVSSGTTYYYRVKAYDASGNVSNPSNLLQTNARVATRYEETSPEAVFDGSWENWDSGSLSGGAALCSVTASDTVTFAFTGTSVTWLTDRGPNQGIADIYIDDVFQQEVDAYSDSNNFIFGPVYTKSGLPSGTHTLKIVVTGRSRMEANSEWVDIDAFDVQACDIEAPTVTASPVGGTFSTTQTVSLTASEPASIYYTTDGTTPTASSTRYIGLPLDIVGTTLLKFKAIDLAGNSSSVYTERYIFDNQTLPAVQISSPANGGEFSGDVTITALAIDDRAIYNMSFSVQKYGTNLIQDLGTTTGTAADLFDSRVIDTTKLSDGEYTITVTAIDDIRQNSNQINIKVNNSKGKLGEGYWGMLDTGYGKVNIADGNFVIEQEDIDLDCLSLGTNITRIYNSLSNANGPLGWGWRLSIPELSQYSDGSVVVTDGDGTKLAYTRNQDGSYNRPVGNYETLTKNANNSFTWMFKDQTKIVFDDTKTIKYDNNGNTVTYQCDASGKLTTITDPIGRVTMLTYNAVSGKLESVRDYTNRVWSYSYDANSNLSTVTNPLTFTEKYAYDNHKITTITDEESRTVNFSYSDNKLTAVYEKPDATNTYTTGYSYLPFNVFVLTNAKGDATTYRYDSNWNITSIIDLDGKTSSSTYDNNFNPLTKTDNRGYTVVYTYDSNGNVKSEKDPLGGIERYTYDNKNNVLSKTNPRGFKTTYAYDSEGNKVRETDALGGTTKFTYDNFGNMITETDEMTHTSTYAYDAAGNKVSDKDPLNHITRFAYDARGNKVGETDANGFTTSYEYDVLDQPIQVIDPEGDPVSSEYDKIGKKVKDIDSLGKATLYSYDWLGRETTETDPLGHAATCTYDSLDNKLKDVDAAGKITEYVYDKLSRMTTVKVTVTDSTTTVTSHTYDANGNKTTTTDAKNYVTSWQYDPLNRVSKTIKPGNRVETTSYDANGNVVDLTKPDSRKSSNVYDALDRVVETEYRKSDNSFDKKVLFTYYADGKRKTKDDWQGVTTYIYDAADNMVEEQRPNNNTITYTYDATNKQKSRNLAGKGLLYNYDRADCLTSIVDTATGSNIVSYAYNPNKSRTNTTHANSTGTHYIYDASNRLTKLESTMTVNGESDTQSWFDYTYYSNNLINTITKSNSNSASFEYDGEKKLTKITETGKVTQYTYDTVGNRKSEVKTSGGVDYTTLYSYDELTNQLTSKTNPEGSTEIFAYDSNGNLVERKRSGGLSATVNNCDDYTKWRTWNYASTPISQETSDTISGTGALKAEYSNPNNVNATMNFAADERYVTSIIQDANYIYVGFRTEPGKIVRISKSNSTTTTRTLVSGENWINALTQDDSYIYAGTDTSPAKIVRISKSDFLGTTTTKTFNELDSGIGALVQDGNYVYATITSVPAKVVRIYKPNFTGTPKTITMTNIFNPCSMVLDASYLYIGIVDSPSKIIRINRADFISQTYSPTIKILAAGEDNVWSITSDANYIYAGTRTSPGKIVRISKSNFTGATTTKTLAAGEDSIQAMEQDSNYVYAGLDINDYVHDCKAPGKVVRLSKSDFSTTTTKTLANYQFDVSALAVDSNYVYAGTYTSPGKVVWLNFNSSSTYVPGLGGADNSVVPSTLGYVTEIGNQADLSATSDITLWLKSSIAKNFTFTFGESAWEEQTYNISNPAGAWTKHTLDISNISAVSKNSVRYFKLKTDNTTNDSYTVLLDELAKQGQDATTTYEYNQDNQLTKVVTNPVFDTTQTIQFTYNGDNERTQKTVATLTSGTTTTETVNYIYDDLTIAQEKDATGNVTADYTYDEEGAPVCVTKGGQKYYYHYNGQGDVVSLTDSTGLEVATYTYDVWGNVINKTGTVDTPFTYRGKYGYVYDKETQLYFLQSRYYDPQIGRFTTKDRFEGFDERPASQNPYTYCENDPVNNADPEGELVPLIIGAGVLAYRAWGAYDTYQDLKNWKKLSKEDKYWAVGGLVGGRGVKFGKGGIRLIKKAPKLIKKSYSKVKKLYGKARTKVKSSYNTAKNFRVKVGIHDAHHPFGWPYNSKRRHIQVNTYIKGKKRSGKVITRIPF